MASTLKTKYYALGSSHCRPSEPMPGAIAAMNKASQAGGSGGASSTSICNNTLSPNKQAGQDDKVLKAR